MQFTTIQLWILLTFTPKLKKETNQKTPQIYAGGGGSMCPDVFNICKKIFYTHFNENSASLRRARLSNFAYLWGKQMVCN